MAKKISQVRYYGTGNGANYPGGLTYRSLVSGSAFSEYGSILQLGIQTMPGTKFYLNGSSHPVIVGNTGIYELNVKDLISINSLQFDAASINLINNNSNAYLIVDLLYEGGNA